MTVWDAHRSLVDIGSRSSADSATRAREVPLPAPERRPRNQMIDVIRFFAAASVVFVHCPQDAVFDNRSMLFRFAVPFYLFASMYYQSQSLRRRPDRSLVSIIAGRFKRLYLPFLAWSLIYLVARDLKRVFVFHLPPIEFVPQLLWKGTEYHLWFLPFLLMWSIVLSVVHRLVLQRDARWRWPLIAIALTAGLVLGLSHMPAHFNETFDNPTYAYVNWWRSGPSICWALAFAWFMTLGPAVTVSSAVGIAGLGIALACSLEQLMRGMSTMARALSGFGLMLTALSPFQGRVLEALARLGRAGFGIYLCHVLLVEFCHTISGRAGIPLSLSLDVATFAVSFAGSLVMVRLLERSERLAWLTGEV